jgi:hypothetical protein
VRDGHFRSSRDVEFKDRGRTSRLPAFEQESNRQLPDFDLFAGAFHHEYSFLANSGKSQRGESSVASPFLAFGQALLETNLLEMNSSSGFE